MPGRAELTIGIDARAAAEVTAGRGRLVRELLRALSQRDDPYRYMLYARSRYDCGLDDRFKWRLIDRPDPWWHLYAARQASRECEVFFSSNSYLTVWFLSIPAVPFVHDMIAFDRSLDPRWQSALIERLTLGIAVRRSAAFLTNSKATTADFARRFPRAAARITTAPLAVASELTETATTAADGGLPDPGFVLAVGTLEPRKNLPRLVAAYTQLPDDLQRQHPLIVVGEVGWQANETLEALGSLGERCRVLGRVADDELGELYRRCAVFCYPSLGEGFGLPVLEAMSFGAAVITSDRSSLPEVGGDAVEYVDPRDTASIRDGLDRLLRDPTRREELGARGRERARSFSWARTAETVLGVLAAAAHARSSA
ncbi:MAG TPA: glycosyltransferase family 1 protein [Solirubrobacteraceae bacterium]|nr:glycosyltransferase family 1 protein [Solirubrobacteraceae bacterium]